uniref:Uncharacterized protein n=1 Tax=Ciona intestinalis TaxID=7719 RepID=H2XKU3_CIOIN
MSALEVILKATTAVVAVGSVSFTFTGIAAIIVGVAAAAGLLYILVKYLPKWIQQLIDWTTRVRVVNKQA